jgi:hypothetical protein
MNSEMREDEKWSSAAFCVHSDTLSPEQMEAIIGLPPTRSHRIGEPRSKSGKSGVHDRHYFSIQSSVVESAALDAHIEEILSLIEPRKERLKQLESEASLCIFCGFSSGNGQGGFSLSPPLLSRLAHLGLAVVLDLYPPSGDNGGSLERAT